MRNYLTTSCLLICLFAGAQNVGIGTSNPVNKLQVMGNLVVNEETTKSAANPTQVQQYTIVNSSNTFANSTDSVGRIYDPGGSNSNYIGNLSGSVSISSASNQVGTEIIIEDIQLGTGDSLIINGGISYEYRLLAVGNGYSTTASYIFPSQWIQIQFKSNADASLGRGFAILFRRLYAVSNSPDIKGFAGKAFLFDIRNAALRAGQLIPNSDFGNNSVAMGFWTKGTGDNSTALGRETEASGENSFAVGSGAQAVGQSSVAMGAGTKSLNMFAFSMGWGSFAYGINGVSIGQFTRSNVDHAVAIGRELIAKSNSGMVVGMYNDDADAANPNGLSPLNRIFQIGNGTPGNARSNALTVLQNGNVGIGTTSPSQLLSIAGGINVDNSDANSGTVANALRFGGGNSGEAIGSKRTAGGNQWGLDFYTGFLNRLSISQSGEVAIANNLTVQGGKGMIRSNSGVQQKKVTTNVLVNQSLSAGASTAIAFNFSEAFSGIPDVSVGDIVSGGGGWAEVVLSIANVSSTGASLYVHNPRNLTWSPNFTVKIIAIGPQ